MRIRNLLPVFAFVAVALALITCGGSGGVATSIVADEGGIVTSDDGKLTLEIPPGALDEDVDISITAIPLDELAEELEGLRVARAGYRLEPDGLQFREPVAVRLELGRAELGDLPEDGVTAQMLVSLSSDGVLQPLDRLATELAPDRETVLVRGELTHFSVLEVWEMSLHVSLTKVKEKQPLHGTFSVEAVVTHSRNENDFYDAVNGEFRHKGNKIAVLGERRFGPELLINFAELEGKATYECAEAGKDTYFVRVYARLESTTVYPALFGVGEDTVFSTTRYLTVVLPSDVECVAGLPTATPPPTPPSLAGLAIEEFASALGLTADETQLLTDAFGTDRLADLIHSLGYLLTGRLLLHLEAQDEIDLTRFVAMLFSPSLGAREELFGNTVFPCDSLSEGRRTVCPAGAGPVPPGEVLMLMMVLDGEVPLANPDLLYTYAAVFDSDGDPANNFQFIEPFVWDFFQGTDRWYELKWHPQIDLWTLDVSDVVNQQRQPAASNARAVIDGNLIVFFIPAGEFAVPRPGYRLTTFFTDGTFEPETSVGDVTGADPTEPLLIIPDGVIVIETIVESAGPAPTEPPDDLVPVTLEPLQP